MNRKLISYHTHKKEKYSIIIVSYQFNNKETKINAELFHLNEKDLQLNYCMIRKSSKKKLFIVMPRFRQIHVLKSVIKLFAWFELNRKASF